MGLGISFKNANNTVLPGAKIYAEDPMLRNPIGVVGLFDSRNILSYPAQANPDANNKYWINRAPSPAVPKLLLGTATPPATDTATPTFQDGGFLFQSATPKTIVGSVTDFNFTTQSFLATVLFNPTAAFAGRPGGTQQGLIGRYASNLNCSWYLYADAANNAITAFLRSTTGSTNGVDFIARSVAYVPGSTLIHAGISSEIVGASLTCKVFLNGVQGGIFTIPQNTLRAYSTPFVVGNSNNPGEALDGVVKRVYIENLTVSGRSANTQCLEDYLAATMP
jgi:hypothetical protein